MAEIYCLFSTRDGKVRYVVLTTACCETRFEQHKRGVADGRYVPRVETWMPSEWREGYPVHYALLQEVRNGDKREVEHLETEWMCKFPNLLNDRKYVYRGSSPPSVPTVREYMRNHKANCGGFRGIFRWGYWDCYSVFTESGEWLYGDSVPGGGGNIYFLDRTQALNARERYRQRRNYNWLLDIKQESEW